MNELKIKDVENLIKEIIMIYKYLENIHRGIDIVPRAKSLIDYEDMDGDRLDLLRYHQKMVIVMMKQKINRGISI